MGLFLYTKCLYKASSIFCRNKLTASVSQWKDINGMFHTDNMRK